MSADYERGEAADMQADRIGELRERVAALEEEIRMLSEAARKTCKGFDVGVWQRSVEHDGERDWALRLLPYAIALGKLARASGYHPKSP